MRWTDPADGRPRRHARVWLDPATWRASIVRVGDGDVEPLGRWIAHGRALVGCRADPTIDGAAFLGVALPDRRRLSLAIAPGAIARIAAPLGLEEAVSAAPAAWRPALVDLVERGRRVGTHFHVYGSCAWQAISGEAYVTARSDVDLLWTATSRDAVDRVVALLLAWESGTGLRPDGELLLEGGGGIAWRELIGEPGRVLVKHADRVSLQRLDRCLGQAA